MKIGDRVFVHGYIDEIRKDTVIIRNNGGYFGTIPSEVITGELPSAQPMKDDTISKQAATTIPVMPKEHRHYQTNNLDDAYEQGWTDLQECIENLPTVQPQQMKGRWLPDNNFAYEMRFVCSVCKESEVVPTIGFTKYKPIWDFCPNCGAKMERNEDGTDMRGEANGC